VKRCWEVGCVAFLRNNIHNVEDNMNLSLSPSLLKHSPHAEGYAEDGSEHLWTCPVCSDDNLST
jgi:hypothetical protein